MNICTDIHGPLRTLNPTDLGDPLIFQSSATVRLTFLGLSEISQLLLDGLP